MNITSSFLPPISSQHRLGGDAGKADNKSENTREVFAELVDEQRAPVRAVVEAGETAQQFQGFSQRQPERIGLWVLPDEGLPLNNQRALASYQSVANGTSVADSGLARLDIIV